MDEYDRCVAKPETYEERIELTTERVDLKKDVKNQFQELEAMESQPNIEKEDFEEAKEEMDQAIAALETAVKVLSEATKSEHCCMPRWAFLKVLLSALLRLSPVANAV